MFIELSITEADIVKELATQKFRENLNIIRKFNERNSDNYGLFAEENIHILELLEKLGVDTTKFIY